MTLRISDQEMTGNSRLDAGRAAEGVLIPLPWLHVVVRSDG
jgi:hypothetical protein